MSHDTRNLEREADRLLRAAAGDDPQQWHKDAGILTDGRQRTIRRSEITASSRRSLWRRWYGDGDDEESPAT